MTNPFEILDNRLSNIENLLLGLKPKMPVQETTENMSRVEYATRNEVSEILRLSLVTLNRLTKEGTLNAYRIGGRVLYKRDEIRSALTAIPNLKYRREK